MIRPLVFLAVVGLVAGTAQAADLARGEAIVSQVCHLCHGQDGENSNAVYPRLAGQSAAYITKQLARIPIQFNVSITAEFLKLIGSIRGLYDADYAAQRDLPRSLHGGGASGGLRLGRELRHRLSAGIRPAALGAGALSRARFSAASPRRDPSGVAKPGQTLYICAKRRERTARDHPSAHERPARGA